MTALIRFGDILSSGTSIRCSLKIVKTGLSAASRMRRRLRHVAKAAQRGSVGQSGGQIVAEPCHPAGTEENDNGQGRNGSRQDARTARKCFMDEVKPGDS